VRHPLVTRIVRAYDRQPELFPDKRDGQT